MGYACPVCTEPQADGEHLANHLAFTAIMGDEAHERWLDEHVPDWGEMGDADLAEIVTEHAEQVAFPFDDGAGDQHAHEHGRRGPDVGDLSQHRGDRPLDDAAQSTLEEARALTREMRASDTAETGDADAGDDPDRDESE